uniref:Reverse transcriptase domain-containing protein n=1 Tax=Angiostrongylus cantonensis TaxID=6313 RepID=A0A0K0DD95_ANGCA
MKADSSNVTKGRLSPETLELIRHCGIARAAASRELTSELVKNCKQAMKDLKERRAAVMDEIEEVIETLDSQGVPTRYTKNLRELYKNFTTKISSLYDDINVDVKRGVRQGDTISPKLLTATVQNVMGTLEWDNIGVKFNGGQLHHLRFADDITLITPNISHAELMLADFDKARVKIGHRQHLTRAMLNKNRLVSYVPFTLNGIGKSI